MARGQIKSVTVDVLQYGKQINRSITPICRNTFLALVWVAIFESSNKKQMKRFKIQDNAGNRFVVYANNKSEARQIAQKQSKGSVIYIID